MSRGDELIEIVQYLLYLYFQCVIEKKPRTPFCRASQRPSPCKYYRTYAKNDDAEPLDRLSRLGILRSLAAPSLPSLPVSWRLSTSRMSSRIRQRPLSPIRGVGEEIAGIKCAFVATVAPSAVFTLTVFG